MENNKKGQPLGTEDKKWDIRERTFDYAMHAVKLFQPLQDNNDRAGWILGKQFFKSATSVGANIEEAQAAESKADFIHKYSISHKEARESLYWLRLLEKSNMVSPTSLEFLINETKEIISQIIINAKNNR